MVEFEYDATNFVQTLTDPRGHDTTVVYDQRGNVVQSVDPLGGITSREFDSQNQLVSETDPLGNTHQMTYDASGNVLSSTDRLGNTRRFTYGRHSRLLTMTDSLGNTTLNTYDGKGNRLTTTAPNGAVTAFAYDRSGNMVSSRDDLGNMTLFEYDTSGNLKKMFDALGNATEYTYDAHRNRLSESITVATPNGVRTQVIAETYDSQDRLTSRTGPEGMISAIEYDGADRILRITNADEVTHFDYDDADQITATMLEGGVPANTAYDAAGNIISSTDLAGRTTHFVVDAVGRRTETIHPDDTPEDLSNNPRSITEYDLAGRVIAEVDERGNRTEFEYDAVGRLVLTRDAIGGQVTSTYDAAGRRVAMTNQLGRTTSFFYDEMDRLVRTEFANGTSKQTNYDSLGRAVAVTDSLGNVTLRGYDALSRLTSVEDALGQITRYEYDEAGNLIGQTDANGHVTEYAYDLAGRTTEITLPLLQTSTTTYDVQGNPFRHTDFNGQTVRYDYDDSGRLVRKDFPGGEFVEYEYTRTGQTASIADARGMTAYEYDERDRLTRRVDPDGETIEYNYDVAGNITSRITRAGATTYTFDALNRLETVTDPDSGVTRYRYDAAGNLLARSLPNEIVETRSYDVLNRIEMIEYRDATSALVAGFTYTMNTAGDRTRVVESSGREVVYAYDALRRIKAETITDPVNGSRTITYSYDEVGNRLTQDDSVDGLTTYVYDNNDRLVSETTGAIETAYTHDDNGNTRTKFTDANNQTTYTWGFENRLAGADVTEGGVTTTTTYVYDGLGNLVSQTVFGSETRYLIDDSQGLAQVLAEYTPGGATIASYVRGSSLISQNRVGNLSFYHEDALGSIRALSDAAGLVTDTYNYDADGRLLHKTGSTDNQYLFAGELRDAQTGLDYLRARYLDTGTGRFISVDPFSGLLESPASRHAYQYVLNNPVNLTDPSGQFSLAGLNASVGIITILSGMATPLQLGVYTALIIYKVHGPAFKARVNALLMLSQWGGHPVLYNAAMAKFNAANRLFAVGGEAIETTKNVLDLADTIKGVGSAVKSFAEGSDFLIQGALKFQSVAQSIEKMFEAIDSTEQALNDLNLVLLDRNPTPDKMVTASETAESILETFYSLAVEVVNAAGR